MNLERILQQFCRSGWNGVVVLDNWVIAVGQGRVLDFSSSVSQGHRRQNSSRDYLLIGATTLQE